MREGESGEEGIWLTGVDGKRRVQIRNIPNVFFDHQQPTEATSQHPNERGADPFADIGKNDTGEEIEADSSKNSGPDTDELIPEGIVQAGQPLQPPQHQPQQVEQQRLHNRLNSSGSLFSGVS